MLARSGISVAKGKDDSDGDMDELGGMVFLDCHQG